MKCRHCLNDLTREILKIKGWVNAKSGWPLENPAVGAGRPGSTSPLLTCKSSAFHTAAAQSARPRSSQRRLTSRRRGGAGGGAGPPPGARRGRAGRRPLRARWVSEVLVFVRSPLGRRLRRRLAIGMPGLPTAPEQGRPEPSAPRPHTGFVLGLDVGSSVIRCHVYDRAGRVRGSSAQKVTGSGRRAAVRVAKASGLVRLFLPARGHLQPGPRRALQSLRAG